MADIKFLLAVLLFCGIVLLLGFLVTRVVCLALKVFLGNALAVHNNLDFLSAGNIRGEDIAREVSREAG